MGEEPCPSTKNVCQCNKQSIIKYKCYNTFKHWRQKVWLHRSIFGFRFSSL